MIRIRPRTCPVTKIACTEDFRCGNFKGCLRDSMTPEAYEQIVRKRAATPWFLFAVWVFGALVVGWIAKG